MTWTRHGECNSCGWCCTNVSQTRVTQDLKPTSDLEYYRTVGFEFIYDDEGKPIKATAVADLAIRCPQHQNNRCAIYATRPRACQDFPQRPEQIITVPGCSYWFENEQGEKIGGGGSPYPAKV